MNMFSISLFSHLEVWSLFGMPINLLIFLTFAERQISVVPTLSDLVFTTGSRSDLPVSLVPIFYLLASLDKVNNSLRRQQLLVNINIIYYYRNV